LRRKNSARNITDVNVNALTSAVIFKYYIHDAIDVCRLQLIGNFTQANIRDISGCSRTAKTTLGNRPLIIDAEALSSTDSAAREWLVAMIAEGALLKPEGYLDGRSTPHAEAKVRKPNGWVSRLLSSTPTP